MQLVNGIAKPITLQPFPVYLAPGPWPRPPGQLLAAKNREQHLARGRQFSPEQDSFQNHGAAMESYKRAKKHGAWRRLRARLTGRSAQPQHYSAIGQKLSKRATAGVKTIALDQIVGTEGRSQDFDNQFWPITEHTRGSWVNIAMAIGTGKPLPPVQLIKSANGYVVRDGHHRISVARALGQEVIEAEVI